MRTLLLLVAMGLGALLFLQWREWPPAPAPSAIATGPQAIIESPPTPAQLPPAPSPDDYASIVERPLFMPDRRPPPDEPEDQEPVPEELADLVGMDLTAVMITPATVSAWVRSAKSQQLVRLRVGDDFEGWSVAGIEPDRLLLERHGQSDELILRDYGNAPAPIPPTRLPPTRQRESSTPNASQPEGSGANDRRASRRPNGRSADAQPSQSPAKPR